MSDNDRWFAWIGKVMCVFALCVVALLTAYAVWQLVAADQSYQHDTTPLAAPPTPTKGGTK